jgi:electron transfer flavoprotein beta subunit
VRILALVKYSLDVAEIKVDAASRALRIAGVPQRFGDADRSVVEVAVRLKDASGGTVEVLCLGPPAAREAVKDLLAMGADEATVIEDVFAGTADAAVAVLVVEAAIRKRGPFDLIVCGFASDDGYSHQTGPRLSERLGLPFVSYACDIRIEDGALVVDRDLEESIQTVSVPLPAIASVAEEAFVPRRVTLLEAMKAQKKPLNAWSLEHDLNISKETLEESSTYEMVSESGVMVERRRELLKGEDLTELADRFIDVLVRENVLSLEGAT